MLGILNAIKEFFEFIVKLVEFLFSLIKDLIKVVEYLTDAAEQIPNYLGFLPSTVLSVFVVTVSIMIIYKIVGRD